MTTSTRPTRTGLDLQWRDTATRPQDDLFQHVNGQWLRTHEIPADRSQDGAFYALRDRAEEDVRAIVEEAGSQTVYRYIRDGLDVLAAMAPSLTEAIAIARGKALVGCVRWPTPPTRTPDRQSGYPTQRRRRLDRDIGHYRPPSGTQKDVNTAHANQRGPGERANAALKSWKIRKIRSSPSHATTLVKAVQTLILAG